MPALELVCFMPPTLLRPILSVCSMLAGHTLAATEPAFDASDVLFHAPFDGAIDAAIAGGHADGVAKEEPSYVDGIRGNAVVVSHKGLSYSSPGNMELESGTVSMWVRPQNWSGSDDEFVHFFSAVAPEQSVLRLYKYVGGADGLGLLFLVGRPGGPDNPNPWVYAQHPSGNWAEGQWWHLAATWDLSSRLIEFYVNGEIADSRRIPDERLPQALPREFTIGQTTHPQRNEEYRTAIDELYILARPLDAEEIANYYRRSAPRYGLSAAQVSPSLLSIPRTDAPPVIDGVYTTEEWARAARVTAGNPLNDPGVLIDKIPAIYACYDDERLYLLQVSPGGMQLKAENRERNDSRVSHDDAIEWFLAPHEDAADFYQFIGNSLGAFYDNRQGDPAWNGDWEFANTLYEGYWYAELSIPFPSLGVDTPKTGESWLANICRNWALPDEILFTTWSFTRGSYFSDMGHFLFAGSGPFARLELDDEELARRRLTGVLELVGPLTGDTASLRVDITGTSPAGSVLFHQTLHAEIPAGRMETIEFNHGLGETLATAVRIQVRNAKGASIFDHAIPVVYPEGLRIFATPQIDQDYLEVEANFSGLFPDDPPHSGILRLLDSDGATKAEGQLAVDPSGQSASGTVDLEHVEKGPWVLEIILLDPAGEELMRQEEPFEHVGRPEWLDRTRPRLSAPPAPWTPLVVADGRIECWGRMYHFEDQPFPTAIETLERPLLSAPIKLVIHSDGSEVDFSVPELVSADQVETVMLTQGNHPRLEVKVGLTAEFDGLLYYDISITPLNELVAVEGISLNIPLAPGVAELIYAHDHAKAYQHGTLDNVDIGRFLPHVWIGNDDIGLTWFTESNEHWLNHDPEAVLRIVPDTDGHLLTITMVDGPMTVDGVIHYRFGLQATPVRPYDQHTLRTVRIQPAADANLGHPWSIDRSIKRYHNADPRWGFLSPHVTGFEEFGGEIDRWRERGINMPKYFAPNIISPLSPEYRLFREEWRNPHGTYTHACANSSFADFTIWYAEQLITKSGLRSIYVDCGKAYACGNWRHGCGYLRQDGSTGLTYPVMALREYFKGLYLALHEADDDDELPPYLWVHMSGGLSSAIHGFTDFIVEGEEVQYAIVHTPSYIDLYSPDRWRAIFGRQYGIVTALLPNYGRVGAPEHRLSPEMNATFMTQVLMHDTLLWNLWTNTGWVNNIYAHLDEIGFRDPNVGFHPYWEQRLVRVHSKNGAHASLYRTSEAWVIVLGNFAPEPIELELDFDFAALGIERHDAQLKDLLDGQTINPEQPVITVNGHNFRLLTLSPK